MSLVNASRTIPTYTDDFGKTYKNLNIKFGEGAPKNVTDDFYDDRTTTISCAATKLFSPRALLVTFDDGTKHRFPLASRATTDIEDAVILLESNGAVCIDLEGEHWSLVPPAFFTGATFKTTPFTDIPEDKVQESFSFDYSPDIQASGTVKLTTRMETAPTALNTCQKSGLENPVKQSGGICAGRTLGISPRKYIISALARKTGDPTDAPSRKVVRNAIISTKVGATILSKITGIASCAYCVGYQGESVKNIHLLFSAPPSP